MADVATVRDDEEREHGVAVRRDIAGIDAARLARRMARHMARCMARRLARLAYVFATLCVVGLAPVPASAFTIIVTETDIPMVPNSILQLAHQLGYFERARVKVDLLHATGTPLAVAALLAREGDMANISLDALLALARGGQTGYRAVSAPVKPIPYVLVAKSAIASLKDLAGKTFGIGQAGTLDATLSERLLSAAGVKGSIDMVSIGPPVARVKALVNGRIDATTVSIGTWAMVPDTGGLKVLVDRSAFDAIAPPIAKVNVVSLDTVARKRDEIVKVTAALMQVSRDFARAPRLWGEAVAAANPKIPAAELARLAELYAGDWCRDDCLARDDLASSVRSLGADIADIDAIADFSIVAEARSMAARSGAREKAVGAGQ